MDFNLLAESVGFVATGLFLYSTILSCDKKLSFYYMIGCLFLASHLFLLDQIIAASSVLISFSRNLLMRFDRKGEIKLSFMFIFIAIFSYYTVTFQHWSELLIPLASVVVSYGFLYTKGNMLSFCIFLCTCLWLIFGIEVNSLSVMTLEITSIVLLMFRILKQNKIFSKIKNRRLARNI